MAELAAYPLGDLVDIVFLPKPGGGERPIGLLCSLMRLWCRCRRGYAREWERANDRDYFWASEARSSEEAVRYQGLQMEAAKARDLFCAGILTDLVRAYEHALRDKLIAFARDTHFPLGLLRMCLACYAGHRRLIVDGQCAMQFIIGGKSLIAGCGFATTLLKVYTIKVFDMMWRWYPEVQLQVFVGDVDINSTADTEDATSHEVVKATGRLLTEFHRFLCLEVGIHKCVLLGSSAGVRARLTAATNALPRERRIPVRTWAKKLGVQYSVQNRRQAALLRQRSCHAGVRASRIRALRGALPR